MKVFAVVTTIHPKSTAIAAMEKNRNWHLILVGDKKSVPIRSASNTIFLSLEEQTKLPYHFARNCPESHYARKNIGYLYAMEMGAEIIADLDDDNAPLASWTIPPLTCRRAIQSSEKFVNIYKYFSSKPIWPRGYPTDEIRSAELRPFSFQDGEEAKIGVWQGLTDGEPDVDALYRLTVNKEVHFAKKKAVYLRKGHYCPINSQNTTWHRNAFPYLYLPATVNFRCTDIFRGYIAQRLLWPSGLHAGFTAATTHHQRNLHNLMSDFADEIPVYLHIKEIVEIIESQASNDNPLENLVHIYRELAKASLVGQRELELLDMWKNDFLLIERKQPWTRQSS